MIVNFPGQGKAFFEIFEAFRGKGNSEEIIAKAGAARLSGPARPRGRGA
jgi:hypothetical protein